MLEDDPLLPKRKRRTYLVDRGYQSRISFTWLLLSYCLAIAVGFFSITGTLIYTKYIATLEYVGNPQMQYAIIAFFLAGIVVIFWMVVVIIIVSVVHSHRVAGAVYRMRTDVQEVLRGDYNVRINLRSKDYLRDLSDDVNALIAKLRDTYKEKENAIDAGMRLIDGIRRDSSAGTELKQIATAEADRMKSSASPASPPEKTV